MLVPLLFLIVGASSIKTCLSSECACAKTAVNVRNAPGTAATILTTLMPGHCLPYKGVKQLISGESWISVDYQNHDGWVHESYVAISTCHSQPVTTLLPHPPQLGITSIQLPGCPRIITRAEWGARAPTHPFIHLSHTPHYFFIHHGASGACHTHVECVSTMHAYQHYHMDTRGYSDIGYNFVAGEDGNIYEARGWDVVGAHTLNYNSDGLAVCFIGNFMDHLPNESILNAVKQLIQCGVANHKVVADYKLRGHRDVGQTACPGTKLYELVRTWPHYNN